MKQPISMPWSAPMVPPPPHAWQGVRTAAFPFEPIPGAVERILPPDIEPADGPGVVAFISYPQSEIVHPFDEVVVLIPVRVGDQPGTYIPYIYVTTDEALVAGREIAGFPKKLATVNFEREGNRFRGSLERFGARLLEVEGTIQGPVPDELVAAFATPPPTFNYKIIPGPAGEIEVEEITSVQLEITTHEREAGQGRLRTGASDLDPIAELVPEGETAMIVLVSDNVIPAGRVLKKIDRRTAA